MAARYDFLHTIAVYMKVISLMIEQKKSQ